MATKVEKLTKLGAVLDCPDVSPDAAEKIKQTYITDEDVQEPRALTIMPPPAALTVSRPPEVVLQEAKQAADALINVIQSSPDLAKKIDGHEYMKFEAWQTIGKFYGATVKVAETKYLEYGEVKGFEAKAVVLNSQGMEISGAEAMCLNDERNWKTKPLFQLRSMAQTRASSKALRNVFAWVVVLAGYKATPAEEMDGVKPRETESAALEMAEGVINEPTLSGGSLWFRMGEDIYQIPPMKGQDMKEILGQATGAFVELKVKRCVGRDNKEYWQVKELVKFEPAVPF